MNDYNALISAKVLDGYEAMLDIVPQPQMLGGKRMRKFVLPGSTEYDYPGTLSVGRMDGNKPATIGGDFFQDFGSGFPTGSLQGSGACGGKVPKGLKQFGKAAAPIAKDIGMMLAKEGIKEGVKSYAKSGGKVPKGLKQFGKAAAPIAKDLAMFAAKEGIKEGVKSYAKNRSASAPAGGRRKKSVLKSVGKVMGSVGKELAPVAREVFRDVIVPEGKKALREYIRESMKSKPSESSNSDEMLMAGRNRMVGSDPRTYTPQHLLAEGGSLIRDEPSQFHSSVYPPALASYAHSFPMGHDAYGRGRFNDGVVKMTKKTGLKKVGLEMKPTLVKTANVLNFKNPNAKGGARSARGAIVSEIMKKHGLSLPEASKFVKEKGLY